MSENGLGRPQKEVDLEAALDMLMNGVTMPGVALELGISIPTLRSRIADIQKKQGLLLQYRSIQALQLTELQARCLEAITPQKINDAPLRDLVASFKILKDKELDITEKPSQIRGLVAHLIFLEKQEQALKDGKLLTDNDFQEAEYSDEINEPRSLDLVDTIKF